METSEAPTALDEFIDRFSNAIEEVSRKIISTCDMAFDVKQFVDHQLQSLKAAVKFEGELLKIAVVSAKEVQHEQQLKRLSFEQAKAKELIKLQNLMISIMNHVDRHLNEKKK